MGLLHDRARGFILFFEAQRLKSRREIFDKMSGSGRGQSAALDGRRSGAYRVGGHRDRGRGSDSGEAPPKFWSSADIEI